MDIMEAIYSRRSIRSFTSELVTKEKVNTLLEAATLAPSSSNSQPWAFVIIQDAKLLKNYSDRAKEIFLQMMKDHPDPNGYKTRLANPAFNIFHNAGTLIVIYGDSGNMNYGDNCCLAAENLMLAAHAQGLGTCWIGFATPLFKQDEVKEELGIPAIYQAVAPMTVGYPESRPTGYRRNAPQILAWK